MPGLAPQHSLPRWTGEPLAGRSLLLLAEQGLGDTLQFVRYARLLKEQGARVVLAAPAALGRLLASHPDLDELFILGSAEELPRCDFYLPSAECPGAFGTTAATIPGEVPYLCGRSRVDGRSGARNWRESTASRLASPGKARAIFASDRWRSIPLAHFAPLASLPGVRLVSLQKGFGSEQVATVDFPVLDLSGRLDEAAGPFMDTAAVIAQSRPGGDLGHGDRAFGGSPGRAGLGCAAILARLALAARSRRLSLVSHDATLPPNRIRPVAGRF